MFAVWSFDAFVVTYHLAWQVCCRSLSLAFPEVAEDAQIRMELLRNPLLSEHEQRVCNVRSALFSLMRHSKRLLSHWINADKVAFLESVAEGVGEALSAGASREAWQKIKCLLAWGGEKRKPRPHARKCVDGSIAQSFVGIANTIQEHFATVECASSTWLEPLAQQHNCRAAIGTVVGVLVVVQRQFPQSQTVQKTVDAPFVWFLDRVVDVLVTVQRQVPIVQKFPKTVGVPQMQCIDMVIDVSAVVQRQVPFIQDVRKSVEVLQVQHIGKVVDVPVVLRRQVPVLEKVQIAVVVTQVDCGGARGEATSGTNHPDF